MKAHGFGSRKKNRAALEDAECGYMPHGGASDVPWFERASA
jgi:hypothetical protein